jgi:hypothetical protein
VPASRGEKRKILYKEDRETERGCKDLEDDIFYITLIKSVIVLVRGGQINRYRLTDRLPTLTEPI